MRLTLQGGWIYALPVMGGFGIGDIGGPDSTEGKQTMRRLIAILSIVVFWPSISSWAQLYPPNEAGVTLAAWHTIVRDPEVTKKFWEPFGGTPLKIDGIDVIKLPGVLVFMHRGEPTGPSRGAMMDHVGVNSPNPYELVKRLIEAGYETYPRDPETLRDLRLNGRAWNHVFSPDGLNVEVSTNPCKFGSSHPYLEACPERIVGSVRTNDSAAPIGSDIVHFYLKDMSVVKGMYDFYAKTFGAETVRGLINVVIPGTKINFADRNVALVPNKGRALDSVGFEVRNLEAFVRKLEAAGVKISEPYSKTRYKSFASAEFTDPFGTSVRLSEGLIQYVSTAAPKNGPVSKVQPTTGVAHGKQVFELHCTYCHPSDLAGGRGDAPALKGLFIWPPHKLADGTEHKEHTVETIRRLVFEGTSRMEARGVILSDKEMDELLRYLQTL